MCDRCKKNEATSYFRSTVNGVTTEEHLCSACAAEKGLSFPSFTSFASPFTAGFNPFAFLGGEVGSAARCPLCGSSFAELQQRGRMGCPECYKTFRRELSPTLKSLHGAVQHTGRMQGGDPKREQLRQLHAQLDSCVREQNYERAAQLRDEIKRLEGEQHA